MLARDVSLFFFFSVLRIEGTLQARVVRREPSPYCGGFGGSGCGHRCRRSARSGGHGVCRKLTQILDDRTLPFSSLSCRTAGRWERGVEVTRKKTEKSWR